jgi:hypothetical protein
LTGHHIGAHRGFYEIVGVVGNVRDASFDTILR